MNKSDYTTFAPLIAGFLFDTPEPIALGSIDAATWNRFVHFCTKNLILVRMGRFCADKNIPVTADFVTAVAAEKERIAATVAMMAELTAFCEESGIAIVFPKAYMHYPDMGHDIDLWVRDEKTQNIDRLLAGRFSLKQDWNSLLNSVAGKRAFVCLYGGQHIALEVHHGRTGVVGEFRNIVEEAIEHHRSITVDGHQFPLPDAEATLVIQAVQRILSHRCVRISDLILSRTLLSESSFDRERATGIAERCGAGFSLEKYLKLSHEILDQTIDPLNISSDFVARYFRNYGKSTIPVSFTTSISAFVHKACADVALARLGTMIGYLLIPLLFIANRLLFVFWKKAGSIKKLNKKQVAGLTICGTLFLLLVAWMLIEPTFVVEKRVTLQSAKIPSAFVKKTIVFVTDLHISKRWNNPDYAEMFRKIKALHPDIVIFGGDYMYLLPDNEMCLELIRQVKGVIGTYAVIGNHDRALSASVIKNTIMDAGITLLVNQAQKIVLEEDTILLYGVDDLTTGNPRIDPVLERCTDSLFTILISHNPDYAMPQIGKKIDLFLSGHTHGGQVSLFGLWAPIVPSSYGNRLRSGIKKTGNMYIIISNGVGTVFPNVRFCTPADYYVITLEKE